MTRSTLVLLLLVSQVMLFSVSAQAAIIRYENTSLRFNSAVVVQDRTFNESVSDSQNAELVDEEPVPYSLAVNTPDSASRMDVAFNLFTNDEFSFDATFDTTTQSPQTTNAFVTFGMILLTDFVVESDRDEQIEVTYDYFAEAANGLDFVTGSFQLLPRSWEFGSGNNLVLAGYDPRIVGSSATFLLDTNTTYAMVMNWDIRSGNEDGVSSAESGGFRFGHGLSIANSIPEPSALILLLLSGGLLLRMPRGG